MAVLEQAWAFLTDPANREVLAWLGGGLVVVLGGAWAVFTYFHRRGDVGPQGTPGPSTSVRVSGGVGGGRNVRARDITVSGPQPAAPPRPEPARPPASGASGAGAKRRKKRRRR